MSLDDFSLKAALKDREYAYKKIALNTIENAIKHYKLEYNNIPLGIIEFEWTFCTKEKDYGYYIKVTLYDKAIQIIDECFSEKLKDTQVAIKTLMVLKNHLKKEYTINHPDKKGDKFYIKI